MLSFTPMAGGQSIRNRSVHLGRRPWLLFGVLSAILIGIGFFYQRTASTMPDFRQYVAGPERKAAFFEFVRPLVAVENQRLRQDRERLIAIADEGDPGFFDRLWLARMADDYYIDDPDDEALVDNLLLRVDTVPQSLALAQSAKESGWGTSRFARVGNNLFGEWCFEEGCGMLPKARDKGRHHEVQRFRSPRHSVASYLHNINTHPEYESFRLQRSKFRARDEALSGARLAAELSQYSERRDAYVREIRQLIRTNELE